MRCVDLTPLAYPAFTFAALAGLGVAAWGISKIDRAERADRQSEARQRSKAPPEEEDAP